MAKTAQQAIRGERSRAVRRKSKRVGDGLPQKRVANRIEDEAKRRFRDMVVFVADGQLRNQVADGDQDRIESIAVAGKNHPGRERPRALAPEGVIDSIDDRSRVASTVAGAIHLFGDRTHDRFRDGVGQCALKARSGPEMMEQIGVSSTDLGRNRL